MSIVADRRGLPVGEAGAPGKLVANGVHHHFVRNGVANEVLRDINLRIESSSFVTIVGASGCGKTTLLRIIDGLILPTRGSIEIDGAKVTGPGRDRSFVFQQDSLFPWRTVLNNVRFGLEIQGVSKRESTERAMHYIRLAGLDGFERHYPYELSGGMRQRVNLARALAIEPQVLLMDEPFASLDAQTREIMQSELLKIWRKSGNTVVFITHQIDEAIYLADQVVVLTARPGRIREVIPIDIPRPRELGVKRTVRFIEYVDRIWRMIEEEVKAGIIHDAHKEE